MSKQQGKSQRIHPIFEGIGKALVTYRKAASAGIAISVIIMQAFISTGITDRSIFISVISFAIAIPFLSLYMFYSFTTPEPRRNITIATLCVVYTIGSGACVSGVLGAFIHLSLVIGSVFMVASIISLVLAMFLWILEAPQN
jgi:hypothetical protein